MRITIKDFGIFGIYRRNTLSSDFCNSTSATYINNSNTTSLIQERLSFPLKTIVNSTFLIDNIPNNKLLSNPEKTNTY
uniref:Uncharacterized protein n=1 Tax=Strongyloides venezuelensis TaxID=75913 RepID=A0A0K0G5Z7_STRVS